MKVYPIVLFAYNKHELTSRVLSALANNTLAKDSDLTVFLDVPKIKNLIKTQELYNLINNYAQKFKSLTINQRDHNFGLFGNITSGITEVLNNNEACIVLEDDIITSQYFLKYMNDGLSFYKSNPKVFSLSSLNFFTGTVGETFFSEIADCWGFAIWKRSWDLIDFDAQELLNKINSREPFGNYIFFDIDLNVGNTYDWNKLLEDTANGVKNSWAVCMHATAILYKMLSLYPGVCLSQHIGDPNSENGQSTIKFKVSFRPISVTSQEVIVYEHNRSKIREAYRKENSIFSKIKRKLHKIFKQASLHY